MELWKKPHELLSMFNENPLNPYLISGFFPCGKKQKKKVVN
jgi:hypothetical protein